MPQAKSGVVRREDFTAQLYEEMPIAFGAPYFLARRLGSGPTSSPKIYFTAMVAAFDDTPPIVITTGTVSPDPVAAGTRTFT